jgi:hypothetical protein
MTPAQSAVLDSPRRRVFGKGSPRPCHNRIKAAYINRGSVWKSLTYDACNQSGLASVVRGWLFGLEEPGDWLGGAGCSLGKAGAMGWDGLCGHL